MYRVIYRTLYIRKILQVKTFVNFAVLPKASFSASTHSRAQANFPITCSNMRMFFLHKTIFLPICKRFQLYGIHVHACTCMYACMWCALQVYGESVEALRVTTVVDCVGILSKHPHLTRFEGEREEEEEMVGETAAERSAHCPPPSLVPRLHCVSVTILHHCNPLLPHNLPRPLPGEGTV